MTTRIWYSGATDITGRALGEALNILGVREKPTPAANDITICWGVKTDRDHTLAGKILNHPNAIRKNRNKLEALKLMAADTNLTSSIAKFVASGAIQTEINANRMHYPIVGRKSHHQGGKGFWLCLNKGHVDAAIADGADYFQQFINIVTEYRVHVFCGEVIYAVKKVENVNEDSWTAYRRDKITDYAQKNNISINNDTVNHVLKIMFKEAQLPNRLIRSNHQGWKFSSVSIANLPAALKNAAIRAVKTVGLDFAAVDCALDEANHPWIIECNSGPGLDGTTLEKYVEAFRNKIIAMETPVAKPAPRETTAGNKTAAAGVSAVGAANADSASKGTVEGMVQIMNAVRTPDEARAVIDLLMGRR